MSDAPAPEATTGTDVAALLARLPFVRELGIAVVEARPGAVTVAMPYAERFSTPPGLFPASVVGAAGDVAAVASCLSLLPPGHSCATLDFTIKMTGIARGDRLVARGRVLQGGRTTSVAAADVFAVQDGAETLCAALLATARVVAPKGG